MNNNILSDINSLFNSKATNPAEKSENINLSDKGFSNIFRKKSENVGNLSDETNIEDNENDIENSLGIPLGVSVEGFEYSNNDIEPEEKIQTTSPESSAEITNPIEKVEQFKETKVSNLYKNMNKGIVNDLNDLISKF